MSQLSAQSILERCISTNRPMITPFSAERHVVNGKSWGLSAASYDVRIAHDLVLGPHPGHLLREHLRQGLRAVQEVRQRRAERQREGMDALTILQSEPDDFEVLCRPLWRMLSEEEAPNFALAHTIEDFALPDNISGAVCDKSSFARVFVSAFNTFFDPGFEGNATLELVNHGPEPVYVKAGDPICQFLFHHLDRPTDRPYRGKYQHQAKGAQPAIYERPDQK